MTAGRRGVSRPAARRGLALATVLVAALIAGVPDRSRAGDRAPVVVELFTSQGCSSCPPADRLLAALAAEPGVVALAFHVDYWNRIGWADPFSSSAWSDRQRRYAAAFGAGRIYTPQLVVDGAEEGVGSDREEVAGLVARALRRPDAVRLSLAARPTASGAALAIAARVAAPLAGRRLVVVAAVVEDGLVTHVGRGENAGRLLENESVVRRLEPVLELDAAVGGTAEGTVELTLDPGWRRDRLRLAVFAQDPESMAIHGAVAAPWPSAGD